MDMPLPQAPGHGLETGHANFGRQPLVHYGAAMGTVLATLAQTRGWSRILPVVTPSLAAHPAVAALDRLGPALLPAFSRIRPHTPFDVVLDLADRLHGERPDAILAIGGGSAIDAVKIAALAEAAGVGDAMGLAGLAAAPGSAGHGSRQVEIVAIPTTLSGAEFGMVGGAVDPATRIKHLFRAASLAPDVVVFDPELGLSCPPDLWLSTGIRAVDHAVETILSRDANPFADALAIRALALLREGLAACHKAPEDIAARHTAQLGTWLAASGIGRVRYGASHGLGHQLGAVAGVPHGITSCVLLAAVMAYNLPACGDRQAAISTALGCPGTAAETVVREFIAALGLPTRIRDIGLDRASLPVIAESALANPFVQANIRPVANIGDALAILESAW